MSSQAEMSNDDYKSRPGQKGEVPVVSDSAKVEDNINAETADSDEQLVKDDKDAIDESNIIDDRTRGAAKDSYAEPGDEEGLGGPDDGRSAVSGGPN